MAQNLESLSNSVHIAELSISFHDELTASIQTAFGVAGELAVAEVSKVIGKAFRDVRDQLHKTMLANRNLQSRLSLAHTELHAARNRTLETRDIAVNTGPIQSEQRIDSLAGVKERNSDESSDSHVRDIKSFREIRLDGTECEQDVKPSLTARSSHRLQDTEDIKEEEHESLQQNASHEDQACIQSEIAHGASAVQIKSCISFESDHAAKMEEDQCVHALSDVDQEFSSDSLLVAQSKLLEDWRPEPLHSCQSDMFESSNISALSVVSMASTSCSQSDMCHTSFSRRDSSSLNNPDSDSHFLTSSSRPAHAIEPFSVLEDVHRYRGVLQPKLGSKQHKSPKRSVYPPGRSPFRCLQCGRDFNRMEHLKIHQRIHTGERPYVCTECTASFRHSWALTRHVRIHTGEKPYLCTQCGKSFRNCGGLRFHQRIHARQNGLTNIRPNIEGSGKP